LGNENTKAHSDFHDFLQPTLRNLVSLEGTILDVGCGFGRLSAFIPNCVGIDVSPTLIAEAQKRNPTHKFLVYDKQPVIYPIGDGECCFVFSYAAFIHLKSFDEMLENLYEIERVLKKGKITGIAHFNFRNKPARAKTRHIYFKQFNLFSFFIFYWKGILFPYLKKNNEMDGIVVNERDLTRYLKSTKLEVLSLTRYGNGQQFFTLQPVVSS